jgi:uncharacterized membrane protein YkgB
MDDTDTLKIARDEAAETAQSISNLDNIGDTAVVGITFLLAALGTWVGFVYSNVAAVPQLRVLFVAIASLSVVATVLSMYFLAESLVPRQFYGDGVGDRFLDNRWLLWRNDDPAGINGFERHGDIESPDDLQDAVEEWIEEYDGETTVESEEMFIYSRLLNYKLVARYKARNTAYGMALLRIAIVCLGILILVGLVASLFY